MAQANKKFSTFAAREFRHKFSTVLVDFADFELPTHLYDVLKVDGMKIDFDTIKGANRGYRYPTIFSKQISFSSGNEVLNLFKHFGHEIKHFRGINNRDITSYDIPDMSLKLVGKLISEYSSESLVDFWLWINATMMLKYIENSLINVENVTFSQPHDSLDLLKDHSIGFNRLFPSVRRLDFNLIGDRSLAYFDHYLPHLEHVSMIRSPDEQVENLPFPGVISKNTQIRSLLLRDYDSEFVKNANSLLPQLETLIFSTIEPVDENLEFEKVTTLEFVGSPLNLHFPKLQKLHFTFDNRFLADLGSFLDEHNHVTHLHMAFNSAILEDSHFQRLTANLSALIEFTLQNKYNNYHRVSSAAIVKFLKCNTNVRKLSFINCSDEEKIQLEDQLKNGWKFWFSNPRYSTTTSSGLRAVDMFFERKTNHRN